jgi:hypothetical protein
MTMKKVIKILFQLQLSLKELGIVKFVIDAACLWIIIVFGLEIA